jgi:hypothetical protein
MALRTASNGFLMRETNAPQTGQMAGESSRYFRRVKTGSLLDLALFLTVNCPPVGDSVNELVWIILRYLMMPWTPIKAK